MAASIMARLERRLRWWRQRALQASVERRMPAFLHRQSVEANHRMEIEAVIAGQRRYARGMATDGSDFLLRRNIHRLEKGLIMRPRRSSFAAAYIGETVQAFERALAEDRDLAEMTWASDVLRTYFSIVDDTDAKVLKARARYEAVEKADLKPSSVPYARGRRDLPVNANQFAEFVTLRRSVRWYLPERVARDRIDAALTVALQSPSACNRQPLRFVIFDDPQLAATVAKIAPGTGGFADQVPHLAVIVGRLRAYPHSRDRHAIYVDGSLAAMSFIYALEADGLASCPINWPDLEDRHHEIAKFIGLDDDERVIMLVAFGVADPEGMVAFSAKKSIDRVRAYGVSEGDQSS